MTFEMSPQQKRVLDLVEQVTVIILYLWMIVRLWPSDSSLASWYPLLILPSEGIVLFFLLIRNRTAQISTNLWDWAIAAVGTVAVLLIDKGGVTVFGALGPYLMALGLVIQVGAKLSLSTSFGLIAANRGLKSGGLYKFVRHPMYAGYIVSHIGFLLVAPNWWNAIVYALAWSVMIARIYAEERVLSEDPNYNIYKASVRYRLMPRVF